MGRSCVPRFRAKFKRDPIKRQNDNAVEKSVEKETQEICNDNDKGVVSEIRNVESSVEKENQEICNDNEIREERDEDFALEIHNMSMISTTDSTRNEEIPHFKSASLKTERFSLKKTTEWNNRTDDEFYYGPYAHIRKTMDYSYHSNYIKTRQWLQDSIIEKLMGELIRTRPCIECEMMASESGTPAVLTNGSGVDVWACPKEPWLIMVSGQEGTDKGTAIKCLLVNERLPVMGFVLVDPQEIRLLLPEYSYLQQTDSKFAIDLTQKETGYIIEILTLAALEAGTNVVVYGLFKEVSWYQQYCQRLKSDFEHLRIAILHIVTDTGEEHANSVRNLVSYTDYYCGLKSISEHNSDMEIMTDGVTWDSFTKRWHQTSAWAPTKFNRRHASISMMKKSARNLFMKRKPTRLVSHSERNIMAKTSRYHDGDCSIFQFSIDKSTEEIHASNDSYFYGPYAHIRKSIDYSYHSNYSRERQLLQDAIIADFTTTPKVVDVDGQVGTTPTEPFLVFTAGAMGAGKGHVLEYMNKRGYFPLASFVIVDPDEIRSHFPEYDLYKSENPFQAGELTRKEAGYIVEILTSAAMQAGKNVLVDGSLRDWVWYSKYFAGLRKKYKCLKISILHVDAPRDAIMQRAKHRGVITGRKIPQETLEMAIKQVPISVTQLKDQVDAYYKFNNSPSLKDVELVNEECTWENFKQNWIQTCAWIQKKSEENILTEREFTSFPAHSSKR